MNQLQAKEDRINNGYSQASPEVAREKVDLEKHSAEIINLVPGGAEVKARAAQLLRGLSLTKQQAQDNTKLQINKITPSHRHIMRMQLRGWDASEIARKLGLSVSTVTRTIASDLYQEQYQRLQSMADEQTVSQVVNARSKLEELVGVSILELEKMLKDPFTQDKIKADIAFDLLDRGGYKAPEKHVNITMDYRDAAVAAWNKRKAMEAAMPKPIRGSMLPVIEDEGESNGLQEEKEETLEITADTVEENVQLTV